MTKTASNNLYPVFLKLDKLKVLLVGAGFVGEEKLNSIFCSAPDATVTVVATEISDIITEMTGKYKGLNIIQKPFEVSDLDGKDLVIAATNDKALNEAVKTAAREAGILANIA